MIVIEAVDTGCWNAITGARQIVTVDECAEELRRGDRVVSLQALATSVGVRPLRPFKRQYTERQLETWRTSLILETGL